MLSGADPAALRAPATAGHARLARTGVRRGRADAGRGAAAPRRGCATSRRSSTSRSCRPRTSTRRPSRACWRVAALLSAHGLVGLHQARHRLTSLPCGSRSRTGIRCPAAPGRRPSGSGARPWATSPSSSNDSRARRRHDPAEFSDPTHFAYWRREADVLSTGIVGGHRRPPGAARRRSRRTPRASRSPASGWRTPPAAGCSSRWRSAGSRAASSPGLGSSPATSCATGSPASSAAVAGPRWPGPPVADVADHLWRRRTTMLERVEALPQVPQHGDAAAGEPPRPRRATGSSPSTGRCSGWATSAATSATTRWPPARSSSRCSRRT